METLLQLPPVSTNNKVQRIFQSSCWNDCIQRHVRLDAVFRQSDPEFIEALVCIRVGAVTENVLKFMEKVTKPKEYSNGLEAVNLYATKSKADNFNNERLLKLDGDTRTFSAKDQSMRGGNLDKLLSSCPAPSTLPLRIGAQVMLVKNLTKDLVNGTVGIVVGFTKSLTKENKIPNITNTTSLPIVRFTMANNRMYTTPTMPQTWESVLPNGMVQCSRTQIPLILSWAITVHKSQGQTIQRLKVDLQGIFESGQVYTALSRAVSADTLEVLNFNPDTIKVDEESLNFYISNDLI